MAKVKIDGNGAIKVKGRYLYYKKGEPVDMPESAAKRTGKEYEVIDQSKVKNTVVSKDDTTKREVDEQFKNLPEDTEFPHNYNGSWYYLSNGEKVNGEANAVKAEAELESEAD